MNDYYTQIIDKPLGASVARKEVSMNYEGMPYSEVAQIEQDLQTAREQGLQTDHNDVIVSLKAELANALATKQDERYARAKLAKKSKKAERKLAKLHDQARMI